MLPTLIEVSAITIERDHREVVREASVRVAESEVVGLTGRNGSGKSTILEAIAGVLRPSAGEVRAFGRTLSALHPWRVSRLGVTLLPQRNNIFLQLSVRDNLLIATEQPHWSRQASAAIERTLSEFPQLTTHLKAMGSSLSGGERQLLAVACAFATGARCLLLDEPCGGLSAELAEHVYVQLRQACTRDRVGALLVEHDHRRMAGVAARVYEVEGGVVSELRPSGAVRER